MQHQEGRALTGVVDEWSRHALTAGWWRITASEIGRIMSGDILGRGGANPFPRTSLAFYSCLRRVIPEGSARRGRRLHHWEIVE